MYFFPIDLLRLYLNQGHKTCDDEMLVFTVEIIINCELMVMNFLWWSSNWSYCQYFFVLSVISHMHILYDRKIDIFISLHALI